MISLLFTFLISLLFPLQYLSTFLPYTFPYKHLSSFSLSTFHIFTLFTFFSSLPFYISLLFIFYISFLLPFFPFLILHLFSFIFLHFFPFYTSTFHSFSQLAFLSFFPHLKFLTFSLWSLPSSRLQHFPFNFQRNSCCVVANVLDCDLKISEFDLQSHTNVHFRTNTLGKIWTSLSLQL